jgi:signal transduction histidine kinase
MGALAGVGLSGVFLLDWTALAVSLANTMLLVWLSMVVWLNSEQRTWGIHLTSGGLLLGACFFIVHSILLSQPYNFENRWLDVWWKLGWFPVVLSPFTWYLVVLWYAGYWESGVSQLRQRQRPFLYLNTAFTILILGVLIFSHPLPSYWDTLQLDFRNLALNIFGIPILIVALPLYILFCLALAVNALLKPGPTRRPMADVARTRARPWLLASSLLLVIVSLLVGWVLLSLLSSAQAGVTIYRFAVTIARYDLVISVLTGLSILCLGQALVSYEIFTGKALPRRGLRRHYYSGVLLFVGISFLVAGAFTLRISAIYGLLLSLLITTAYFALLTWRTFQERDWAIRQLRPFVASQRFYDHIIQPTEENSSVFDVNKPFLALCQEVLDTQRAVIIATGPLAPLVPEPLVFSIGPQPVLPDVDAIYSKCSSPDTIAIPLQPVDGNDFAWAVPLWSERGLIGIFLLGEKISRGFYTQEEIEVARASGERLIDVQASLEIIRRMTELQREQMVSSQVIDRRTRRTLHDEILPELHTIILSLSIRENAGKPEVIDSVQKLSSIHHQISTLLLDLPTALSPDLQRLGLVAALRNMVQVDLAALFDRTTFILEDGSEQAATALPALTADVLFFASREAVRNAAAHARGEQPLHLKVSVSSGKNFKIVIEDDGTGMPLLNHRQQTGSGQGLVLHSTLMAVIGGSLTIETKAAEYTRVILII